MQSNPDIWKGLLAEGIASRSLPVKDLEMHFLECGNKSSPLILLLHGFPELSFSWRAVIVPLAQAGYRVVAPDQRGYGRTVNRTGPVVPIQYQDDLQSFRMLNLVADVVALVSALGYKTVEAVVGHDFGSSLAGSCALVRSDIFKSVVLMSAPFPGPPSLPFDVTEQTARQTEPNMIQVFEQLGSLSPPRKHYVAYFSGPTANDDILQAPQGLHAFLRGYFHIKSADWKQNNPHPLSALSASALAVLPHYYVMPLEATMADVAHRDHPSDEEISRNTWLTDSELTVYAAEYARTGFQGGLNRYRCMVDPRWTQDLFAFSGMKIEVPAMFLSGNKDWGVYQAPGAAEKMKREACSRMADENFVLVEGAGHWVQQEQPAKVVENILRFLKK